MEVLTQATSIPTVDYYCCILPKQKVKLLTETVLKINRPVETFKMAEEKDMEITFLPTDTSKIYLHVEELLLNMGRRPQTSQKARKSPHTWVGQKKTEKTESKE